MKAQRKQFHQHIDAVVVHTDIGVLIRRGEADSIEGKKVEDPCDVDVVLIGEDVDGHEDDVEVGDGFEEGDVCYEDGGMIAALLLEVEEAGDQERNCVR